MKSKFNTRSTETIDKDILRGGQFLVKETKCEDVFTLEDLSEEQRMMRDSTKEFVDRELWAHWEKFENKDYACLLYTSPSPRDQRGSRMPSSA